MLLFAPPHPALQPYGVKKWHLLTRMSGVPGPPECGVRRCSISWEVKTNQHPPLLYALFLPTSTGNGLGNFSKHGFDFVMIRFHPIIKVYIFRSRFKVFRCISIYKTYPRQLVGRS